MADLASPVAGTKSAERKVGGFTVHRLEIVSEEASKKLGKPRGHYRTVDCGRIDRLDRSSADLLSRLLAGELRAMTRRLIGREPDPELSVLVMGLGNAELTADAVGPLTVSRLTATRHLCRYEKELYDALGCSSLSALAPGVLGQTGIETLELLRGAVRSVRPDLILAVDALAARSCDRLASTVQLSDTGIEPGSGVGNHRSAITHDTVGVPVLVLGVPTVVNSSTLVYDALEQAGITDIGDALRRVLESGRSFFVSPKESDVITAQVATVLSDAIRHAFTGSV